MCLLSGVLLLSAGPALADDAACPPAPAQALSLPRLQARIRANKPAIIVALGSSSTEGWMASDAGHTYPAVLQAALTAALPSGYVSVIDRGIGGQDAREELARLDADVLAIRPQLVIWQVGANGVLRHTAPERFTDLVTEGVHRLQEAGVDVVLMDNQRSPKILANPTHAVLEDRLADVAKETGANLFRRTALMDWWQQEGHPYAQFVATDGLHQNDLGYQCVAMALAAGIVEAVAAKPPAHHGLPAVEASARRVR